MNKVSETLVTSLTLEEALEERQRLVDETTDIQTSLGDRNRTTREGERMTSDEYWDWRRRALHALRIRQKRLSMLKDHIRNLRMVHTVHESGVKDLSDFGLLKAAYALLRNLKRDEVEFEEDEVALMDVIRERINTGKAVTA